MQASAFISSPLTTHTTFNSLQHHTRHISTFTTTAYRHHSTPSSSKLHFLIPKKTEDGPKIKLTPEEDDALRIASENLIPSYGYSWFEKPEAYVQLKKDFPVLASYSDDDLKDAFLKQKPKLADIFLKTPLGPFILINVLAYVTKFSWCNTPFHFDGACPPV